jgi:hypothetical protein
MSAAVLRLLTAGFDPLRPPTADCRLFAFEDSAGIDAGQMIHFFEATPSVALS